MEEYISKSRLYRDHYLPFGITRLRNGVYARVIGTENDRIESDAIDRMQLTEVALNYLIEWESQGGKIDQGLKESIETDRFIAQTPVGIIVDPFPLLLECRKCGSLDYYKRTYDDNHAAIVSRLKGGKTLECTHCRGPMQQIPLISVHRCGLLTPISLPRPAMRSNKIKLDYKSSTVSQSRVVDLETKKDIGNILQYAPCNACSQSNPEAERQDGLIPKVVSPAGGDAYVTHNLQYISLDTASSNLIRQLMAETADKSEIGHGILDALVKPDNREKACHRFKTMMSLDTEDESVQDAQKDLDKAVNRHSKAKAKLASDPEDDFIQDMVEGLEEQIAKLMKKLSKLSPFASPEYTLPASILDKLTAQRRCYEVMFLDHDAKATSKPLELSKLDEGHKKDSKEAEWISLCETFGIDNISHLSDLKVVLSAIGFSREIRKPSHEHTVPVILNGFTESVSQSTKGQHFLYGMTARTEAIWLRLDASKVLQWMVENFDLILPDETILHSKEKSHLYILEQCPVLLEDMSEIQQASEKNHPLETAPFQLLHSISHSLVDTAKLYSGYDQSTLMEYILPADLSVIFYVTSVQNYTSGGLLTMFRHHLIDWISDASEKNLTCLMDPVCSEESGACPSCIQISRGCETFNTGLSRSHLVGGKLKDGCIIKKPFWS
jgi:hypothetical protein